MFYCPVMGPECGLTYVSGSVVAVVGTAAVPFLFRVASYYCGENLKIKDERQGGQAGLYLYLHKGYWENEIVYNVDFGDIQAVMANSLVENRFGSRSEGRVMTLFALPSVPPPHMAQITRNADYVLLAEKRASGEAYILIKKCPPSQERAGAYVKIPEPILRT